MGPNTRFHFAARALVRSAPNPFTVAPMKHFAFAAALTVTPLPALAEDSDVDRGLSLLEEGAALMLEGLLAEIEPRLLQLEEAIDGLNAYHPPEVLPNGDIIIRRRHPTRADEPGGEIDL